MKRLLSTLTLAGLMLAGCNHTGTKTGSGSTYSLTPGAQAKNLTAQPPAPVVYKTLNGVDKSDALQWIKNYHTAAITASPSARIKVVSYFLNKDMVTKITDLLTNEATSTAAHKTDGVRIYFAKKSATDPETILLLVSTIDSASTQYTHHDYYGHSAPVLYDPHQTDLAIKPDAAGSNAGAVLYNSCANCPPMDVSCVAVNYPGSVLRNYAESMIQKFDGSNMNTDAVWFPISLFKRMRTGHSFGGIRIYLATYPDDTYGIGNTGRNTVVLTTVDSTGKDYFYCESDTSRFEKSGKKIIRYRPQWGPPENNGSLCPNNCN